MPDLPDAITERGKTTSEFKLAVAYGVLLVANAAIRAKFGHGLTEPEQLQLGAAFGIYWYGRDSLKKRIIKEIGGSNAKPSAPPVGG